MKVLAVVVMLAAAGAMAQEPQEFRFVVEREKLLRDEPGTLVIGGSGVSYESEDGDTVLRIPFADVYEADVSDRSIIRIQTYDVLKRRLGGRRAYTFQLRQGGRVDDVLAAFLTRRVNRPVLGWYASGDGNEAVATLAAYHRHTLGGCNGTIEFASDTIRFVSEKQEHNRSWRYEDMETIGSPDPFGFRLATFAETYRFDLKERLPADVYEAAWRRIYELPRKYAETTVTQEN